MPRRPQQLSLPQDVIDEAETAGGCAGEMMNLAYITPSDSPGSPVPIQRGAPGSNPLVPSMVVPADAAEQLHALRSLPLDEQVYEVTTALLREHIAKQASNPANVDPAATAALREAFELAFPRTERSVNRRNVVCASVNVAEVDAGSSSSVLERLVEQTLLPNATPHGSVGTGSFGMSTQASLYFNMAADGKRVDVNGLNIGTSSSSPSFRLQSLDELNLPAAEIIGKGAGGRVLRVSHRSTGELFAVKEIFLGSDGDVIKQIEAEISILWGTSHRHKDHIPSPFLVTCQGVFYREGTLYVVMELMDGSLKDALDHHGPFSEESLRGMAYQMLHGLQYMHFEKRQLHRDIKPHNVLYNRHGWVKLSDFGIASDKMETAGALSRQTFCGTLLYMSPRRAEGDAYGFEADLWSLGITLYQLALGKLPTGNNIFEIIQMHQNPPRLPHGPPPPLHPSHPPYSPAFHEFLSLCLDPEATAASTTTVRQLLLSPWMAGMTLDKSQRAVQDVFRTIARGGLSAVPSLAAVAVPSQGDGAGAGGGDVFASLDAAIGL